MCRYCSGSFTWWSVNPLGPLPVLQPIWLARCGIWWKPTASNARLHAVRHRLHWLTLSILLCVAWTFTRWYWSLRLLSLYLFRPTCLDSVRRAHPLVAIALQVTVVFITSSKSTPFHHYWQPYLLPFLVLYANTLRFRVAHEVLQILCGTPVHPCQWT